MIVTAGVEEEPGVALVVAAGDTTRMACPRGESRVVPVARLPGDGMTSASFVTVTSLVEEDRPIPLTRSLQQYAFLFNMRSCMQGNSMSRRPCDFWG